MSDAHINLILIAAFSAAWFGLGYWTSWIIARNSWRDEMIRRKHASYNWMTGKWQWGFTPATMKDLVPVEGIEKKQK
jgi:hypothetical protein